MILKPGLGSFEVIGNVIIW